MIAREVSACMAMAALAASCDVGAPSATYLQGPKGTQLVRELAMVRGARVLFMHHSVGRNLLAGVVALDAEAGGGRMRLMTLEDAIADAGPMLAHFSGGRNTDPKGKMDAFALALQSNRHVPFDFAFMKLCYADIDPRTDLDGLLAHYERTIASIRRARPDVRIGHVTVPLKTRPSDLKARIRRFFGLMVWEDAANVKRAEFNERLARAFPNDAIFDLANVEATRGDGRSMFEHDGHLYPALHSGYSEDGGHLNESGRRAAAGAAIRFLSVAVTAEDALR